MATERLWSSRPDRCRPSNSPIRGRFARWVLDMAMMIGALSAPAPCWPGTSASCRRVSPNRGGSGGEGCPTSVRRAVFGDMQQHATMRNGRRSRRSVARTEVVAPPAQRRVQPAQQISECSVLVATKDRADLVDHRVQTLLRRVDIHGSFPDPASPVAALDAPSEEVESFVETVSQRAEECSGAEDDGTRSDTIDTGGSCTLVAPPPVLRSNEERWVTNEVEQVIETATRLRGRPTVQLGLHHVCSARRYLPATPRSPQRLGVPLGPFAMYTAFLCSDYYDPSSHPGRIDRQRVFPSFTLVA